MRGCIFVLYPDDTFMITSCEVVFRVTLQKTVPLGDGNVLGRYSSPLFRLKSYTVMESTSTLLHHTAWLTFCTKKLVERYTEPALNFCVSLVSSCVMIVVLEADEIWCLCLESA